MKILPPQRPSKGNARPSIRQRVAVPTGDPPLAEAGESSSNFANESDKSPFYLTELAAPADESASMLRPPSPFEDFDESDSSGTGDVRKAEDYVGENSRRAFWKIFRTQSSRNRSKPPRPSSPR